MDFVYVVIIDTFIALFLSATGISHPFAINLLMSQCYGISISAIIFSLLWIFKPGGKTAPIVLIIAVGVVGGNFIGGRLAYLILRRVFSITLKQQGTDILQTIVLVVAIGATVSYFFYSKARLKAHKEIIQQERITRLSSEKEALEANLRLLQAQIEPHFLFNTLSNVLSLIDTDPAKGKIMLSDLIHYLRTSLSRTLPATTTLDQEMDMCRTYLSIQKVRMGERLSFAIDFPDALSEEPLPPMLLQPLVENAIKHGLEPSVEGGEVFVEASEKDGMVRITVADTGAGLSAYEQAGIGLANVRERIRLIYGDKGRLLLEENTPHGVRAIIEVPKNGL
jgi:sensor histidine kinase YesM